MIKRAETFVKRIQTSDTTKPNEPNLFFKNSRNRPILLYNIGIVPNKDFLTRGRLIIEIDEEPTLLDLVPNDLIDIADYNINFSEVGGLIVDRNANIKFYAWNNVNAQLIAVTITFIIGERF